MGVKETERSKMTARFILSNWKHGVSTDRDGIGYEGRRFTTRGYREPVNGRSTVRVLVKILNTNLSEFRD